jgi:hypothetical protein
MLWGWFVPGSAIAVAWCTLTACVGSFAGLILEQQCSLIAWCVDAGLARVQAMLDSRNAGAAGLSWGCMTCLTFENTRHVVGAHVTRVRGRFMQQCMLRWRPESALSEAPRSLQRLVCASLRRIPQTRSCACCPPCPYDVRPQTSLVRRIRGG